ncbi:hypothetical protein PGTUg99_022566 [Puccinia graminis f. sp. tritici]|uniref:Uncharacterized protein n=1 Tax=Puccinia graminis f. sp. tritici TaxID=56615 RepID=A0A5B0S4V7_PUCGR|nr:hypothetical protein PGTUg99_022566 [Puccinia graminis f. sp. tritici]
MVNISKLLKQGLDFERRHRSTSFLFIYIVDGWTTRSSIPVNWCALCQLQHVWPWPIPYRSLLRLKAMNRLALPSSNPIAPTRRRLLQLPRTIFCSLEDKVRQILENQAEGRRGIFLSEKLSSRYNLQNTIHPPPLSLSLILICP